jgi:hypothetical protein
MLPFGPRWDDRIEIVDRKAFVLGVGKMKSDAIDPDVCSYDPPRMREFGLPTGVVISARSS